MIANVFDSENRFSRTFEAEQRNNLVVLTAVTQKFEQILFKTFPIAFQRYLSLKYTRLMTNETIFCDLRLHNGSRYDEIFPDTATCLREVKRRCSNYTNVDIKSFCSNVTQQRKDGSSDTRMNATTFNKQLVFRSEHVNLFDFITSTLRTSETSAGNQESGYQFDFIVLDFKSILLNATSHASNNEKSNKYFTSWRPLMILKQDQFDKNMFTLHRAASDDDDNNYNDWLPSPMWKWKCEAFCWSVIAAVILVLIVLIVVVSLSVGIAAR